MRVKFSRKNIEALKEMSKKKHLPKKQIQSNDQSKHFPHDVLHIYFNSVCVSFILWLWFSILFNLLIFLLLLCFISIATVSCRVGSEMWNAATAVVVSSSRKNTQRTKIQKQTENAFQCVPRNWITNSISMETKFNYRIFSKYKRTPYKYVAFSALPSLS